MKRAAVLLVLAIPFALLVACKTKPKPPEVPVEKPVEKPVETAVEKPKDAAPAHPVAKPLVTPVSRSLETAAAKPPAPAAPPPTMQDPQIGAAGLTARNRAAELLPAALGGLHLNRESAVLGIRDLRPTLRVHPGVLPVNLFFLA